MTNAKTRKLVFTAMFAVINYVAFTYGKITIPVTAGTSTAIHIANDVNAFSVLLVTLEIVLVQIEQKTTNNEHKRQKQCQE